MQGRSGRGAAIGKLGVSMCLFGTIGLFVRYIPLPSAVIALVRGVIGTLFLLLVLLIRRSRPSVPDIRRNALKLCIAGVCLGANWMLLFEAYRFTSVATATLCYYLAPVFVTLASPLVLGERLTPAKALCAAAALVGMALISGVLETGLSGMTGILLGLGAAALYACIMLLNKKLTGISAYDRTVVQLAVSAVTLLPYVLLTGGFRTAALPPLALALLVAVGVLHTGVAYALYFGSMQSLPAQTVALFSYIDPVVAILLSTLVLKEPMGPVGIAGAVLVLGATLLSELSEHRQHRKEPHSMRTMRRIKQQLSDEDCIAILENGTSGVLAVAGDGGYPYAVPLSYVYDAGRLYFHSAPEGHKVDAVQREPRASFCVVAADDVRPAEFTTYYRSVVVFGKARLLADDADKARALSLLTRKYSPAQADGRLAHIERDLPRLSMIELNIEHMTGKEAAELTRAKE